MKQLNPYLRSTLSISILVLAVWTLNDAGRAGSAQTQDTDKFLEIERYPDEPLEIVEINIGPQSVKDKIKVKSRDETKWGRDIVRFKENNGWFKAISIRLRNVSDKPIYGLAAAVHFEVPTDKMLFRMLLTRTRDLERQPLQPGEEIVVGVDPGLLKTTRANAEQFKVDLDSLPLSFSVDSAIFSDTQMWYRGSLMKRDPKDLNRWNAEPTAWGANRTQPQPQPQFQRASFKRPANRSFDDCQSGSIGILAFQCPGDLAGCAWIHEVSSGIFGNKSHHSSIGQCEKAGLSCQQQNLHNRLVFDSTCQCWDQDTDGYLAFFCGGDDCNDNNRNENPGGFEGQIYIPGFETDCSTCADGDDNDCDGWRDQYDPSCQLSCTGSPVLIDVAGNGFDLTNGANGVNFDLNNDGSKEKLSWTTSQTDDAWLALDRNGDGMITNGTELFGNFTPQADPRPGVGRNGFNALVEYDQAAKGGNGDNLITNRDSVFANLRLWQDKNHNGVSETNELHNLEQLGLTAIECDYRESKRRDQHGNQFLYRAKVIDSRDTKINRWAWDVFLVRETNVIADYVNDPINRRATDLILRWSRK